MKVRAAKESERAVEKVKSPRDYYQWLSLLQSESRSLDFKEKWRDSLKSVNAPDRLGPEGTMTSDRWYDLLALRPDQESDLWDQVRDWEQFQKYLLAAHSIFESPLYEGRAGVMSKKTHNLELQIRAMDKIAQKLHKAGLQDEAYELCLIRDKVSGLGRVSEVYDMFSEDKASPHMDYTLRELESMPTLSQSQTDDLKVDEDGVRVWLSRMDPEDGMPYHSMVTVEVLDPEAGRWEEVAEYQAKRSGE